ncbi:MAG: 50S ribosomal protein L34 [Planctomycetes bacterium]|nr:50S ribosomal protein L34 [Planctomycetota bacterium]
MKKRIRKSSLIRKKRHGFRSKPRSHMPRGKKLKNVKSMLRARRKRRATAKA